MNFFQKIIEATKNMMEIHQKSQALRTFVEMSDKQLDDIGISRAQLQRGIKAFPWREEVAVTKVAVQQPIAEVLTFKKVTPATAIIPQMNNQQPKLAA